MKIQITRQNSIICTNQQTPNRATGTVRKHFFSHKFLKLNQFDRVRGDDWRRQRQREESIFVRSRAAHIEKKNLSSSQNSEFSFSSQTGTVCVCVCLNKCLCHPTERMRLKPGSSSAQIAKRTNLSVPLLTLNCC